MEIYGMWPWYIAGPLITFTMLSLVLVGRRFGISSSLETICSMGGAGNRFDYFNKNWKSKTWLLIFIVGTMVGGAIANYFLPNANPVQISMDTVNSLQQIGITHDNALAPTQIFSVEGLTRFSGVLIMVGGGFLIGFGTRWAGGCTSGHAISGLANLQLPSLIAVVGFFIGGLISTFFLLPLIF